VMANNKLKYWRVNPKLREQYQQNWNQPVLWPLWIGVAALLLFALWLWRALKKREDATTSPR
jgi:oligopeptide transport system substrate-binding protein